MHVSEIFCSPVGGRIMVDFMAFCPMSNAVACLSLAIPCLAEETRAGLVGDDSLGRGTAFFPVVFIASLK